MRPEGEAILERAAEILRQDAIREGQTPDFRPESVFWCNRQQWEPERKPLHAMQTAICQTAIKQWAAVAATEPGRDGRRHRYTPDEKARFVAAMEKEIADRLRTGRAACEEVVVPWLPAPGGWVGFDARRAQGIE